jgi:hypothetical protein
MLVNKAAFIKDVTLLMLIRSLNWQHSKPASQLYKFSPPPPGPWVHRSGL